MEDEDIYAPLGVNDEYDSIQSSAKAVAIANRPPAPTPRPESTQVKQDKTPYIAKGNLSVCRRILSSKTKRNMMELELCSAREGEFGGDHVGGRKCLECALPLSVECC